MTNLELIEVIKRMLHGAQLSGHEASEIIALVLQQRRKRG